MPSFVPIHGLHHFAYRCRDAEETRHFYEDILGLPLVHVITQDRVPSTQEYAPHAHIFFRMTDGSCIAFFDLGDGQAAEPSPNTAPWVNHLALRVDSVAGLETAMAKLRAAGVDTLRHGRIKSSSALWAHSLWISGISPRHEVIGTEWVCAYRPRKRSCVSDFVAPVGASP